MGIHGPGGGQRKEKQKWTIEKPKVDNARRLQGTFDNAGRLFTSLICGCRVQRNYPKNARRKLEVLMPATILCKLQREKYRETCRVEKDCKTKYACIVEADESS